MKQQIKKNQLNIERKYEKSVVNKLYIFPRICPIETANIDSSSSDSDSIPNTYDLKSQNRKNKKGQTQLISY